MVGVMIDSLDRVSRLPQPVEWQQAHSRFLLHRVVTCIIDCDILSKAQQKLVIVLYITKQKFVFSIVVFSIFYHCLSSICRSLSFDDTLLGGGVAYSCPISYAS